MPLYELSDQIVIEFREYLEREIRLLTTEKEEIERSDETILADIESTKDIQTRDLKTRITDLDSQIDERKEAIEKLASPSLNKHVVKDSKYPESMLIQELDTIPPNNPVLATPETDTSGTVPITHISKEKVLIQPFIKGKDDKIQTFKRIEFVETLDGKVAIKYIQGPWCYTTKVKVLQIPYPIPPKFFDTKGDGWHSTLEGAIRNYRKYLAEQETEDDPDRIFKPFLKTDTHVHGDDYEKIGDTALE